MENLGENLYGNVFVEISMTKSLCENSGWKFLCEHLPDGHPDQ